MDRLIPGGKVLEWLSRSAEEEWRHLVDCAIDDGTSLDAWTIIAIWRDAFELVSEGASSGQVTRNWSWLRGKQVEVPASNTALIASMDGSRTEQEKLHDQIKQLLHQCGFDPEKFGTSDDLNHLIVALATTIVENSVPDEEVRSAVYEIIGRCGQYRQAVTYFRRWLTMLEPNPDRPDLLARLHLAVILRYAGRPEESLAVSEVVDWEHLHWSERKSPAFAMLCCDRAATLLDLYERIGDENLLYDARRLLGHAWARNQSDEVSLTFNRWRSLKRQHDDAQPSMPVEPRHPGRGRR